MSILRQHILSLDPNKQAGRTLLDTILNEDDPPYTQLSESTLRVLEQSLDSTISNIQSYLGSSSDIVTDLSTLKRTITTTEQSISESHTRIESLINQINKIHPELSALLSSLISTHSAPLAQLTTSSSELAATSIETSLLQLSLVRSQALLSLYGHADSSGSSGMTRALVQYKSHLDQMEQSLVAELSDLDHQLTEYDAVGGPMYSQIIQDWLQVQQVTEECKRDLRRLQQ